MVLITGGAGYIGTHTLIELANAGYNFIVYDNLSNSSRESLSRAEQIIKKDITFIEGDIRDSKKLDSIFREYKIDSVIHFAGLKAVGESVQKPLDYYDNNINGTVKLLESMNKANCKKIIFSSSATVYGDPKIVPITEKSDVGVGLTNPYGRSKYFIEEILKDLYRSDSSWKIIILRYFNPVGAHSSGLIGEDPNGVPNNLMPYITQVAVGKLKYLNVFGDDYPTDDGTGVRDYIHVVDLANGHLKALEYIDRLKNIEIFNLGTGVGYSVLDMISAFKKASGKEIEYKIAPRRDGDIAECYADSTYATDRLKWIAKRDIEDMCRESWNWQSKNPNGYSK